MQPHLMLILECLMSMEETEQNAEQQQGEEKPDRFLTFYRCSTFHCYFKKKIIGLQEVS